MRYHFCSLSDTGRVRPHNEDAVLTRPTLGLAVLADGIGGRHAGEVASALATASVSQYWEAHGPHTQGTAATGPQLRQALVHALQHANATVWAAAQTPEHRGMGTTVVAIAVSGQRLAVAHVGDSRLYRLRQGQLALLTRDHTLLQAQIDAGLLPPWMARNMPHRHVLNRALGTEIDVDVEAAEHHTQPGDTYLLCSDGLNDMLTDHQIASLLLHAPTLELAAQALVSAANEAGGSDNVSLTLLQCTPSASAPT